MRKDQSSTVCSSCGRLPGPDEPRTDGGVPWTWSTASGEGRSSWLCPACARENARSIEAKLDTEWW